MRKFCVFGFLKDEFVFQISLFDSGCVYDGYYFFYVVGDDVVEQFFVLVLQFYQVDVFVQVVVLMVEVQQDIVGLFFLGMDGRGDQVVYFQDLFFFQGEFKFLLKKIKRKNEKMFVMGRGMLGYIYIQDLFFFSQGKFKFLLQKDRKKE